jgi:adenylosuccinate synthase
MTKVLGNTLVFGGQVGSEGKGAIVGYLARKQWWQAAICTFMTNAGHTWIGDNGEKVVVQQLPLALVNPHIQYLMIAPGSAITLSQLEKELNELDSTYNVADRLQIHPRAMIIDDIDIEYEREHTKYLGSTSKGCGSALARKALRKQDVRLARDVPWLKTFISDTTIRVNDIIDGGNPVLFEGSQGFDLDINHGLQYPYCTSRGTTPQQVMADCGVSERCLDEVIAVIRTYPIRVGNIVENGQQVGYSGDFGGKELTWEEVTKRSGSPVPLEERTTVTQRVRRVFEMDFERLSHMASVTRPTIIALTFADYIDYRISGKSSFAELDTDGAGEVFTKVTDFMSAIEDKTGAQVQLIKTGAKNSDIIDYLV